MEENSPPAPETRNPPPEVTAAVRESGLLLLGGITLLWVAGLIASAGAAWIPFATVTAIAAMVLPAWSLVTIVRLYLSTASPERGRANQSVIVIFFFLIALLVGMAGYTLIFHNGLQNIAERAAHPAPQPTSP